MSDDLLKYRILNLIGQRTSEHPISSADMFVELSQSGYLNGQSKSWVGAKVRLFVHEWRCEGKRICSDGDGYWLAPKNEQGDNELLNCCGRREHRCKEIMMANRGMIRTVDKGRLTRELFEEREKV